MELSRTAYVILGMIKLGRRTGYEIKALVDVSARFFWAASYGQIYPELKRLEEQGLIEGENDSSDGRRRRVYSLTGAGEETLHRWLTSNEPLVNEMRHEGVLKFFLADALSPDERIELVRRIREEHERLAAALAEIEAMASAKSAAEGLEQPRRTAEWGVALNQFNADWCARLERELEAKPTRKTRS
jgi:PadR family transcriptional regulator, regulatory protein AphA